MLINPSVVPTARANRAFLARAIRYLTGEVGLRQFPDIGTGMPASSNIHEVAQSVAPQTRVVYVDHDPIVLCHARALLISAPEGRTDFIEADLRQPLAILSEAARTLDFGRPIAIILTAILHLILDDEEPYQLVRQLVGALAPGSYVVISHAAADIGNGDMASMTIRLNELMAQQTTPRNYAQLSQFFEGLDLVEPAWSGCPSGARPWPSTRRPPPRCGLGLPSSQRSSQPSSHSDPGQAPAEPLAFPRWQHVSEPAERGGDVAVERARHLAPLRRERDGNRPPVTRHRGPGDQAAAFGPVGQPGERGFLDAEQAGQLRHAPRPGGQHAQQPGLGGRQPVPFGRPGEGGLRQGGQPDQPVRHRMLPAPAHADHPARSE
jgi:S-adenosyl methyltransferase